MADHRSAALLIRVWFEDAGELRARLLTHGDGTSGSSSADEVTVAVASSSDEVLHAVRTWLDEVAGQAAKPGGRHS